MSDTNENQSQEKSQWNQNENQADNQINIQNHNQVSELTSSHVIVEGDKSLNQESSIEVVSDPNATLTNQKENNSSHESEKFNNQSQEEKTEQPSFDQKKEIEAQPLEANTIDPNLQEEDLSQRIAHSNALKETAKFYVKGGNYNDAIKIYESAFYALKPTAKDRAHPDFKKCISLQIDLFNNLCLCYENIERYQEAIAYAKRVLIFEDKNTKALFRLASVLKKLGNNLEAYDYIKKCIEAFKDQNHGEPLDAKIHELYLTLKESCKEILEKRENKEKEIYSKMLGTSRDKIKDETENSPQKNKRDPLSWKPVRYGLFLGPSIVLGVILARIIKQKSIETAKNHAPAILTAFGAILVLTYIKNHVRKSVLGLGLAAAAALMVQRTSKSGFWKAN